MPPQPNMQQMMRQVQKMQADMAKAQEELKAATVTGSDPAKMVTVTVTGDLNVTAVEIKPDAIDPDDPDLLQDLVLAAVNDGLTQAQALAADRMGGVTGGMDLGGLGLPGF